MFQYWMAIKSTKKLNQPSKHQSQGTHHVAASYRTVRSFVLRENAIHMIQYTRLIDLFQFFDSWLTFPLGHDATQLAMIIKSENGKYIEIPNPIIEILADVSFIESPMFTPALSHPWTHASSRWRAGRHDWACNEAKAPEIGTPRCYPRLWRWYVLQGICCNVTLSKLKAWFFSQNRRILLFG